MTEYTRILKDEVFTKKFADIADSYQYLYHNTMETIDGKTVFSEQVKVNEGKKGIGYSLMGLRLTYSFEIKHVTKRFPRKRKKFVRNRYKSLIRYLERIVYEI